jgi:hypothetical protein
MGMGISSPRAMRLTGFGLAATERLNGKLCRTGRISETDFDLCRVGRTGKVSCEGPRVDSSSSLSDCGCPWSRRAVCLRKDQAQRSLTKLLLLAPFPGTAGTQRDQYTKCGYLDKRDPHFDEWGGPMTVREGGVPRKPWLHAAVQNGAVA